MTAKLFTGGLDSKQGEKQLPEITGDVASAGEKARIVGDGNGHIQDRYLKVPDQTSDFREIDLDLGVSNSGLVGEDSVKDIDGRKVNARRARIKWTSSLLDRIAAVRAETGEVENRLDRVSRRLRRLKIG